MGRRTQTALLFVLVLSAGACVERTRRPEAANEPALAPPDESRETTVALECSVTCTDTFPREALAIVRWSPTKEAQLNARSGQRLEATIYKNGFEEGAFVGVEAPTVMELQSFKSPGKETRKLPPALTKLRTVLPPKEDANLRLESTADKRVVLVTGLEPGVNYFWRIAAGAGDNQVASTIVRCQAPVCPFDQDSESERRK
jgi:hypothetical protein